MGRRSIQLSSFRSNPLYVAYEDEYIIVASKPTRCFHSSKRRWTKSYIDQYRFELSFLKGHHYAEHIHRLDEGTKGLVVIAKNPLVKKVCSTVC